MRVWKCEQREQRYIGENSFFRAVYQAKPGFLDRYFDDDMNAEVTSSSIASLNVLQVREATQ